MATPPAAPLPNPYTWVVRHPVQPRSTDYEDTGYRYDTAAPEATAASAPAPRIAAPEPGYTGYTVTESKV